MGFILPILIVAIAVAIFLLVKALGSGGKKVDVSKVTSFEIDESGKWVKEKPLQATAKQEVVQAYKALQISDPNQSVEFSKGEVDYENEFEALKLIHAAAEAESFESQLRIREALIEVQGKNHLEPITSKNVNELIAAITKAEAKIEIELQPKQPKPVKTKTIEKDMSSSTNSSEFEVATENTETQTLTTKLTNSLESEINFEELGKTPAEEKQAKKLAKQATKLDAKQEKRRIKELKKFDKKQLKKAIEEETIEAKVVAKQSDIENGNNISYSQIRNDARSEVKTDLEEENRKLIEIEAILRNELSKHEYDENYKVKTDTEIVRDEIVNEDLDSKIQEIERSLNEKSAAVAAQEEIEEIKSKKSRVNLLRFQLKHKRERDKDDAAINKIEKERVEGAMKIARLEELEDSMTTRRQLSKEMELPTEDTFEKFEQEEWTPREVNRAAEYKQQQEELRAKYKQEAWSGSEVNRLAKYKEEQAKLREQFKQEEWTPREVNRAAEYKRKQEELRAKYKQEAWSGSEVNRVAKYKEEQAKLRETFKQEEWTPREVNRAAEYKRKQEELRAKYKQEAWSGSEVNRVAKYKEEQAKLRETYKQEDWAPREVSRAAEYKAKLAAEENVRRFVEEQESRRPSQQTSNRKPVFRPRREEIVDYDDEQVSSPMIDNPGYTRSRFESELFDTTAELERLRHEIELERARQRVLQEKRQIEERKRIEYERLRQERDELRRRKFELEEQKRLRALTSRSERVERDRREEYIYENELIKDITSRVDTKESDLPDKVAILEKARLDAEALEAKVNEQRRREREAIELERKELDRQRKALEETYNSKSSSVSNISTTGQKVENYHEVNRFVENVYETNKQPTKALEENPFSLDVEEKPAEIVVKKATTVKPAAKAIDRAAKVQTERYDFFDYDELIVETIPRLFKSIGGKANVERVDFSNQGFKLTLFEHAKVKQVELVHMPFIDTNIADKVISITTGTSTNAYLKEFQVKLSRRKIFLANGKHPKVAA